MGTSFPELLHGSRELPSGLNLLCDDTKDPEIGIRFSVARLEPSSSVSIETAGLETALVVIRGDGSIRLGEAEDVAFSRTSWIDQTPTVVHAPAGFPLRISARSDSEVAVVQTRNPVAFPSRVFQPPDIRTEHRGQGKLEDTAYRLVRTAFDRSNAPEAARLVIGEVVNLPGRWSSYPPHHHAQPELYYYRFSPEQGYGHAECGDNVYKVHANDILRIRGGNDHAQAAAPGYHMYYLWAVRHLETAPYTGFEYTPAHRWTFEG